LGGSRFSPKIIQKKLRRKISIDSWPVSSSGKGRGTETRPRRQAGSGRVMVQGEKRTAKVAVLKGWIKLDNRKGGGKGEKIAKKRGDS